MGSFPERQRDDVPVPTRPRHAFGSTKRSRRTVGAVTLRHLAMQFGLRPLDDPDETLKAWFEQAAAERFVAAQFEQAAPDARVETVAHSYLSGTAGYSSIASGRPSPMRRRSEHNVRRR